MKSINTIESKINRLPKGHVFTYSDFNLEVKTREATIKALNRMAASGKIAKLTKGKYYKPEVTIFGNLQPNQYQVVKDLLEDSGKVIGYLTTYSIYNQLGLTTQVSNIIQIGRSEIRPSFKRENCTISFVKQKNIITKDNIPLLQILDAIRFIKKIPDSNNIASCQRFLAILKDLGEKDKQTMVRLAQKYPPVVRAILGALLDELGENSISEPLKKLLNPITTYKISGLNKILTTTQNWNIK